ncbi:MAG: ribonuclease T2 family protein [Rhodopila sp.]
MINARSLRWILATAALLATATPGQARPPAAAAKIGSFDFYLLSLSIAPTFCAISPDHQTMQECQQLTEAAFEQTPLTVHGLWPNRVGVSVNLQPHDCAGPPLGTLSDGLQADLRRYMPGGEELEDHEWTKHGKCSGLSPEAYFSTIVSLARHVNDTIGAVMKNRGMLGQQLHITDLLLAVQAKDPALAQAIVVDCAHPRGGGGAMVEEIRIVLSKDLHPKPASSVRMGHNAGCPAGAGLVPKVKS